MVEIREMRTTRLKLRPDMTEVMIGWEKQLKDLLKIISSVSILCHSGSQPVVLIDLPAAVRQSCSCSGPKRICI